MDHSHSLVNGSINDTGHRHEWNNEFKYRYLPNTIINAAFLVFGIFGNILVVYVYKVKVKTRREDRYFIMILAVTDLIHSVFSSNLVFVKNSYPTNFPNDALCKILLYFTNVFFILSLLVLVVICIHRYRKICHPLKSQLTYGKKQIALIAVTVISVVLALPKIVYFKVVRIEIERGLQGHVCGLDVTMAGAIPVVSYSTYFLLAMSIILILLMGVLYGRVGNVIYRQMKHFKDMKDQSARLKLMFDNLKSNGETSKENEIPLVACTNHPALSVHISIPTSSSTSGNSNGSSTQRSTKRLDSDLRKRSLARTISASAKAHKSSIMFIVITIITILSFIPTWIFVIVNTDTARWFRVSNTELQLFLFMRALHAVGYVANPVIYAYYDRSFRTEVKRMLCRKDDEHNSDSTNS